MTDLIERLRDHHQIDGDFGIHSLREEAADEIERLNERIAKLEGANRHLHTLIQENMGVRNEFQDWDDYEPPVAANKQETEIEALRWFLASRDEEK